eukprot:45807-Chlamydomonas_euryale.AAC.1
MRPPPFIPPSPFSPALKRGDAKLPSHLAGSLCMRVSASRPPRLSPRLPLAYHSTHLGETVVLADKRQPPHHAPP